MSKSLFVVNINFVRHHTIQYLEVNGILSQNEHGFRNSRSCLTQDCLILIILYNDLRNYEDSDLIDLDNAKALDKDDHRLAYDLICNMHAKTLQI